jgi:tetratricopeptide (TPR) repeat protein
MLLWLNLFKWWRTFQLKRRWKRVKVQFIDSYHRQDWVAAESAAISMVNMLAGSDLRSRSVAHSKSLLLDSHYSLMLCYRGMERFDEATAQGELVLDLQRSLLANLDDLRVVERLCDLAEIYSSASRVDDAIKLYGQALAALRRVDGARGSQRLVNTLESLATIYISQELEDKAEKLFAEAQDYRHKLGLVTNDDELGQAITQIKSRHRGEHLTDLEQWTNLTREVVKLSSSGYVLAAIPIAEQALELAEKIFPDDNNDLATSWGNLADLYRQQGRLSEAETLCVKALDIRKKLHNKPNNDLAACLNNLALLYHCQGRLSEAEPLYKQALGIRKKLFPDHNKPNNDLAISINNLAGLYESQGRWTEAEPLYKQALGITIKLHNKPNNDLAACLNNLANLYRSQGRLPEAETLCVKALDIRKKLFPDHNKPNNNLAISINNLAGLYESQGRWAEAEPLYEQALDIRKKLFPDHNKPNNDLAISINNLAELYRQQGRWAEAELLCEQALDIRKKIFPDHNKPNNNLATSLNNLALLYRFQGRWAEAELLYEQALDIRKKIFPDHNKPNNDLATSLGNLAELYRQQGRLSEAEPFYVQALEIRKKLFNKNGHPDLVNSLTSLAITKARLQPNLALPLFQQAIAFENHWLTNIIPNNDSQQRLRVLEESQHHLELLLALTQQHFSQNPATVNTSFDAVLNRKAQAASAEASFSQAIRNYPHLALQFQQLKNHQQEIATLSYAIGNQPEFIDQLNNLLLQRNSLEREICKSIPALDLQQQVVDRLALTTLLPTNSFLVEFIRYNDFDFANSKWQDARYLAFIVEHDQAGVIMLDCGLADPLDQAINNFRNVQANRNFDGQSSGFRDSLQPPVTENLADFLDRLLPHLPNTGTCFLAPDSHLHILPFHLLKTDDEYLGDRYQIHYLNTARDLLRRKMAPSINPPLVLANPDYDGRNIIPFPKVDILCNPKTELQTSAAMEEEGFEPLPINKILGELVADAYQVPCYSGEEATVERFKQADSPQLLMIATHGFSLPPQTLLERLRNCPIDDEENIISQHQSEITSELREFWQKKADQGNKDCQRILAIIDHYGVRPPATDILHTPTSDPMLRCGFALAGANIWRFQGIESPQFGKGIIFAQDVMQCNLWGTELALIATCVSGMGDIKNSEGVFGLRRALAIAGAKYVITSLWNIPTKPSALLMEKFFNLYKSGMLPATALSAAQKHVRDITLGDLRNSQLGLEVIAELQSGFLPISDDTPNDLQPLSHPYFWGAWICQG